MARSTFASCENGFGHEDDRSAEKLDALVELGSGVHDETGQPVLSARYHLFVRATEGAFVAFNKDGPRIFLSRHEVDPDTGRAVFEFGTCTRCGAIHLAGDLTPTDGKEYFVPAKKADGRISWLVLADADGGVVVDEDEITLAEDEMKTGKGRSDHPAVVHQLRPTRRRCCDEVLLVELRRTQRCCLCANIPTQNESCPGAPNAERSRGKGFDDCAPTSTQHPLSSRQRFTNIFPEASGAAADQVGAGRKLLMFSDSRQAAAFAAPYLDRTYTRMLERRYITQALRDPVVASGDLTLSDLAILTKEKAQAAGQFAQSMGSIEITQSVNQWISGELMTLETRQSLEGLGLMRVALRPEPSISMRGFTSLGLTEDEGWALLNELAKSVRMQGAVTVLDRVDVKDERFAPRNTRVRMRSIGSDRAKQIISWLPSGTGTTNCSNDIS